MLLLAASQALAGSVLGRVSQSVVKIETADNAASGFIWPDASHVVTSLHVVDGQQGQIIARYVDSNGRSIASSRATVEKVLTKADLVLLRLKKPLKRNPLPVVQTAPAVKQTLDAVGFPLNIAGHSSTEVKVRFGGKQLRSILPPKVLKKFRHYPYPSTTTLILNLEGNLVPGLSGAPVVDAKGRVAGIADGGLESGAIGISWGIPASQLARLSASDEHRLPNAQGRTELFAADLQADVGKTQQLGRFRLTRLRSRSFQQLAATADDQLSLAQLATFFSIFSPDQFRYDIYQEMNSGATIAIPEGASLSQDDDFFVVDAGDSRMQIKFRLLSVDGFPDAQNKATRFEMQIGEYMQGSQLVGDPAWSYLQPLQLWGTVITRKAFFRNIFNGVVWQPDKYYFETLATDGQTLLAVAAINHDNSRSTNQAEAWCMQALASGLPSPAAACPRLIRSRSLWAQMVLGVQFTSLPPRFTGAALR